ncbi:MAG: CBS domain-containing protein, partial [Planctomycetota bacterium]|nr:CBS domain-containing protein [Planctomycetota bacterium]
PVVDTTGRVRGLVHALDAILDRERPTADLIGPVETVGPRTPALEAIRRMRRSRVRLAVVVGPNQRPLGIVGLKDLVEPLTGDLRAW